MKLSGSYKINVQKGVVWKALNDSNILKQCIPGCESFEKESDNIFNATATNQIGPMNATFSGKITISNIKKNDSFKFSDLKYDFSISANLKKFVKLISDIK